MFKIRGKIIDKQIETIDNIQGGDPQDIMFISILEAGRDFDNKYQFEIFGKEKITVHQSNVKLDRFALFLAVAKSPKSEASPVVSIVT